MISTFGREDMKRLILILLVGVCCLLARPAHATPYRDNFVGVTVKGHEWGAWRIVDVPLDPDMRPYAFAGSEDEEIKFITYWCLGVGPFVILHVSQGLAICVILLIAGLVGFRLYRRKKTEPTDREVSSESALSDELSS